MRLTDLLGYEVRSRAGERLGKVSDLRVVQDGPLRGTQAMFRVDAFVVGKGGLAERLGYIRGRVQGPWLVAQLFRRLEQRSQVVAAADVDRWDHVARVIHLVDDARRQRRSLED